MRNLALLLRFDGTRYHGWQTQKEDITVCATVSSAIEKTVGHKVTLIGCGRTDAGVHAERYVANFHTDASIPCDRLPYALNTRLPGDVACLKAEEVSEIFNAIGSLCEKEYTYRILNARHRDPLLMNRAFFYPYDLDFEKMRLAARHFVGTHDFAAVRSVGTEVRSTVRTVFSFEASRARDLIELRVCANGFLYNMARAMAGTVIYAGRGKLSPEDIPGLLLKKQRSLSGPTAPACGLYMTGLKYREGVSEAWLEP